MLQRHLHLRILDESIHSENTIGSAELAVLISSLILKKHENTIQYSSTVTCEVIFVLDNVLFFKIRDFDLTGVSQSYHGSVLYGS